MARESGLAEVILLPLPLLNAYIGVYGTLSLGGNDNVEGVVRNFVDDIRRDSILRPVPD
ncbi:MAG: hypothetical protein WA364_04970 [Candidatus Nitrosopolaris sp.]